MMLNEVTKELARLYIAQKSDMELAEKYFNINEGLLHQYVVEKLKPTVTNQTFKEVESRLASINIYKRLISKLSKIYEIAPQRIAYDSNDEVNENDQSLIDSYKESFEIDTKMTNANQFFNMHKSTLIEPFVSNGMPKIRAIPRQNFVVLSKDDADPMRVTHVFKIMGRYKDKGDTWKAYGYAYSDTEFAIINEDGETLNEMMISKGADGINPYGTLPFIYINRSQNLILPFLESDSLEMTTLIPILVADLAYAIKYQTFSIVYGIDIDFTNIEMNPNALWNFKSDPTNDKQPQLGVIKPQVDTDKVLSFIVSILQLWFETKNIKSSSMDSLTVNNAASGIAKAIDQADTSADRTEQTKFFAPAENELFLKVINNFHPVWSKMPDIDVEFKRQFSNGAYVRVSFPTQKPLVDETSATDNALKKKNSGLIPSIQALREMYPYKSDYELTEFLDAAKDERGVTTIEQTPEKIAE